MTAPLVRELQQRIDGALSSYRSHPDYEDLRQEAWLRLLQADRKHQGTGQYQDLRRIAGKTARWAAYDYFREGHGIRADHEGLANEGYEVVGGEEAAPCLRASSPDFAPGLINRLVCEAAIPWRKFSPTDRQILWQVGARGVPMRTVARRIGRHFSYVNYRYHRALRFCRGKAQREARAR